MSEIRSAVGKGLFLAVGVLSAAIGAYGTNLIQKAEVTKEWPTKQGKIVAAEVRPGDTAGYSRPVVRFEYTLHGTIFRSEQFREGVAGQSMKTAAAEDLVKKYPVGAQVQVHYDPLNPFSAVLEPGDPTPGYLVCAFAVVLLGLGAIPAIANRRKGKR